MVAFTCGFPVQAPAVTPPSGALDTVATFFGGESGSEKWEMEAAGGAGATVALGLVRNVSGALIATLFISLAGAHSHTPCSQPSLSCFTAIFFVHSYVWDTAAGANGALGACRQRLSSPGITTATLPPFFLRPRTARRGHRDRRHIHR